MGPVVVLCSTSVPTCNRLQERIATLRDKVHAAAHEPQVPPVDDAAASEPPALPQPVLPGGASDQQQHEEL
jgi:hypothetical protein